MEIDESVASRRESPASQLYADLEAYAESRRVGVVGEATIDDIRVHPTSAGVVLGMVGRIDEAIAGAAQGDRLANRFHDERSFLGQVMDGLVYAGDYSVAYSRFPALHRAIGRSVVGNMVYKPKRSHE